MTCNARRLIAVVDDDLAVRDSLRFLLETAGYVVSIYGSGAEFLAEANPACIACLVLDQKMPQLDGLDLLERLRAGGMTTPTLLIVSTPSPTLFRRAAELGVIAVVEKPLSQDDLVARIEDVLA